MPGTKVTIYSACLGVTDDPPDELPAAFMSSSIDLQPTDPSVPKGVAKASAGTSLYVVVVPQLYQILLECLPGDWRTNLAEGGAPPLKILSGAPDTSTSQDVGARPPSENRLEVPLLMGLALVGGIAAHRRLTPRRSQNG